MKRITINRAYAPDPENIKIELHEITGYFYEYNNLQFCICFCEGMWYAIELQTGHAAAQYERRVNDTDDHCIDEVKRIMCRYDKSMYDTYMELRKNGMINKGFSIPINEKIQTDESN